MEYVWNIYGIYCFWSCWYMGLSMEHSENGNIYFCNGGRTCFWWDNDHNILLIVGLHSGSIQMGISIYIYIHHIFLIVFCNDKFTTLKSLLFIVIAINTIFEYIYIYKTDWPLTMWISIGISMFYNG